jgi:hypothetical protein
MAATTVDEYLDQLAPEARDQAAPVVALVRERIPAGYEEALAHGMPTWQVPLADHPDTYNGEPLAYLSLAARKSGISLYLVGVYVDPEREKQLRDGFGAAGKKVDLGKSCLRFKRTADLDADTLGDVIAALSPTEFIARHEAGRARG